MENKYAPLLQQAKTDEVYNRELVTVSTENTVDNKILLDDEFSESKNKSYSRMPARATRKTGFSRIH